MHMNMHMPMPMPMPMPMNMPMDMCICIYARPELLGAKGVEVPLHALRQVGQQPRLRRVS